MPDQDSNQAALFVLYAAKSTVDTNESISSQLAAMREYVAKEGGEVVDEFSDQDASGFTKSRGPGLLAAKKLAAKTAAANPDADVALLVFVSDRLARGDGIEAQHLVEHLLEARKAGYRLDSVTERLDDLVMVALLGERANLDSKAKVAHIRRGMQKRAARGDYHGGPAPYGFKWRSRQVGDKLVRDLVHDRARAAIVRRIFREWVTGGSQAEIARDLHREKVPATRTLWTQPTVRGILKNPIYAGLVRLKGEIVLDERGQPVRSTHKAILDMETWEAAQRRFADLKRTRNGGRGRRPRNGHLFTNAMLRCGMCGGPMVPRSATDTYFCFNRSRRDVHSCSQGPVPREEIDGSILDYFAEVVLDVDATLAQLKATEDTRREEVTAQRKQAESERLKLAGEHARVERDYRAGELPAKLYRPLAKKIADETSAAEAQVEQLRSRERELSAESLLSSIEPETAEWCSRMRAQIVEHVRGAADIDAVRAALLTRFERFVLHRSEVTRRLGAEKPLDRLKAGCDYYIELFVRPEAWPDALLGFRAEEEDGAQWLAPEMRRVPLSMRGNPQSSASPSQ